VEVGYVSPRLILYVISDVHLDGESSEGTLFDDRKNGPKVAALCERIARENAELVLAGDAFDLTSMTPPKKGLGRFYEKMDMRKEPPPRLPVGDLCVRAREANPIAVEALAQLCSRVPVSLIPGNHDRHLGEPDGVEALSGIGFRVRLERSVVRKIGGRTVVLQHGHELDEGNSEREGRGEVMTHVLHQAVIPFLREKGPRRGVRMDASRVVALRPEEAVVSVLERWLDEKTFRKFFRALIKLLAANGYIPRVAGVLSPFITANRVRRAIEEQDRLWESTAYTAIGALEGRSKLAHDAPQPDVIVFGHTHVLDWAVQERGKRGDGLYVNLGTWTERCFDAWSPPDLSLPVLRLDDEQGRLRVSLVDLANESRELQRFESA
jgi:UDP-2,3-diacylglucosamine pyrophosphatase LpxH